MTKKVSLTIAAVVVFVFLLATYKGVSIYLAIQQGKNFTMPPEAITSIVVAEEKWRETVPAIGTVRAVNGVELSADLAGVVASIHFESGTHVKKGDLLVQQDIGPETGQLRAAESKQALALINVNRAKGLLEKRVNSQSAYDEAAALFLQTQANSDEIRATIARKTIRAPFDGLLGIRQVDIGQYLQPATPIVSLQQLDPIYVNFSLPQQRLPQLQVGRQVIVKAAGLESEVFEGKITAVNAIVTESTRNIQVQATLPNTKGLLRPGMFVSVEVVMPEEKTLLSVPSTAISYAPYGDSIFIVEEQKDPKGKVYKGVRQQIVKLGEAQGDRVEVVSGLKAGEEVATSGIFKLRPNAAVQINNSVQPSNELKPNPEDS